MYYEPQSGMYFSYDPVTQTHQYHERVSAAKFSLLTHIIYNRRQPTHSTEKSHKLHKVRLVLMCLIRSYGDCLGVKREYYQNCSVLGCVTQCSQSAVHLYEQFLQVQQIGFVTLGPLRCA